MQADRYSRLVGWLKVLFPLMALALLSTLFLLSRAVDQEAVIPFADKEIQDRLRDQQVTGPVYQSITADGDEISFSAEKLTTPPGEVGSNQAEIVKIVLDMATGATVVLNAQMGRFDVVQDRADLEGDVIITTSTGYRIESDKLITHLTALDLNSPGPVAADGPPGTLNAGAMTLRAGKQGKPAQLVFTNGVKLIYTPKQDEE